MSGKKLHPLNPRVEEIDIGDIAYALASEIRFSNHCDPRYTVAQHSWIVSYNVSKFNALAGLLHDASEAYLRDIARPIKSQPCMYEYRHLELRMMDVIARKFGFNWPNHEVELVDKKLFVDEAKLFMKGGVCDNPPEGLGIKYIEAWKPEKAEAMFLNRFWELTK